MLPEIKIAYKDYEIRNAKSLTGEEYYELLKYHDHNRATGFVIGMFKKDKYGYEFNSVGDRFFSCVQPEDYGGLCKTCKTFMEFINEIEEVDEWQ